MSTPKRDPSDNHHRYARVVNAVGPDTWVCGGCGDAIPTTERGWVVGRMLPDARTSRDVLVACVCDRCAPDLATLARILGPSMAAAGG